MTKVEKIKTGCMSIYTRFLKGSRPLSLCGWKDFGELFRQWTIED